MDEITQLVEVIALFEIVHPGSQALFVFDNSQNHHAASPTGLSVTNLNITDGGKNMSRDMRNGWFLRDGVRVEQRMCHEDGTPKGLETLLKERGLFREPAGAARFSKKSDFTSFLREQPDIISLKLNPDNLPVGDSCKVDKSWAEATGFYTNHAGERVDQAFVYSTGEMKGLRTIVHERLGPKPKKMTQQEMKDVLGQQPDFLEQEEWLRETVRKRGHLIDYFPKYHCELNAIEKVWAVSKRWTRSECDFTLEGLRRAVPESLDRISPDSVQRFFRSSMEYIMAYKEGHGLSYSQVQNIAKRYKSHRKVTASW